ncbi:MAG: type VI secretion system contractile sheath protein TssC, partial [Bacteroidetes bacterium]|nr:type VI secretion system contractile sheath protein TssC [Bacteroidota bacterium]
EELVWAYGKLGKAQNYSMMVVPGCIGSNMILRDFADMARDNKVMMLTDFHDLSSFDSVLEEFEDSGFADLERTNVVMACNWLIARAKDLAAGETDDLTIPPSVALAGKLYDPNVPISQPSAGKRYGTLEYAENVRFDMLMEHIGQLDEKGLIPLVKDFNVVMPYSARTLSTTDDVGLQTYSVVRVFDWVGKVIMDFLNQAGFENASQQMLDTYRGQIAKFLNSITGPNKLIKDFRIHKFEADTANGQPDRILVHIVMDPLFPAKSFALKMDGTSGEGVDNYIWNTNVAAV